MKYINVNIIYLFYKVIIILKIKVGSTVAGVGYSQTVDGYNRNQQISRIVGLTGGCPMK